ncbi:PNPLA1 [Scenedesmus sp. PABB004]|nr:PNPLA1 [Scenedesmus sp. PABB004]
MAAATAARQRQAGKAQQHGAGGGGGGMAALEVEQASLLRGGARGGAEGALAALSGPLVLESGPAFRALLIAPLVVWWLAIFAGMWWFEGLPHGTRVHHALLWFDRGVLRPAGPLVPFAVLAARAAVHWGEAALAAARGGAPAPRRHARGGGLGSLLLSCAAAYAAIAAARLGIYLSHVMLLRSRCARGRLPPRRLPAPRSPGRAAPCRARPAPPRARAGRALEYHLVSDHIFLAATMLICLHAEVICLLSDLAAAARRRAAAPGAGGRGLHEAALVALLLASLFLYLFTAADMYFTAKYFHFPLESFSTAVIVFVLFQLPMLTWITWQRRAAAAASLARVLAPQLRGRAPPPAVPVRRRGTACRAGSRQRAPAVVWGPEAAEATLERLRRDAEVEPANAAGLLPDGRVSSIAWPGAGTLLFWQLGAWEGLRDALGASALAQRRLIGASSGAVLCVLAACDVPPGEAIRAAAALAARASPRRRLGLAGAWGGLLRALLRELLPPDAAARCIGRVTLLSTGFPWLVQHATDSFGSADDVVAAVLASCHIPLLLDGRWSAPAGPRAARAGPGGSGLAARLAAALPAPRRCIDGNFWLAAKRCRRGFAPPDGSAALLLEPQQDAALERELAPLAGALRGAPGGLHAVSEADAWRLFGAGRAFAERAAAGRVALLVHLRRRAPPAREG